MIVSASLDFELGDRIGAAEGRNSEVYMAFDPQLAAQVVVKKIAKSSFKDVAEYFSEAKRLYDARHPNVVDVKYACQDANSVFLAMPYYAGGSIAARLDQRRMTNRKIVKHGLDFLHGLHHVHTQRMVHFDVKPSNVLIDNSGKAALTDFGLSRHLRSDGLATPGDLYVLHWPPEYLLAGDLSPAADIYQAGLTLYRMCVGLSALEEQAQGKDHREVVTLIQQGRFPDRAAKAFPLHVPARLVRLVRTALQVDPDTRYRTILDMLIALADVDQWLDWQCYRDRLNDTWSWEVSREGQHRIVTLSPSQSQWSVAVRKRNERTGMVRRQHALSGDGLTWGKARQLVQSALSNLE